MPLSRAKYAENPTREREERLASTSPFQVDQVPVAVDRPWFVQYLWPSSVVYAYISTWTRCSALLVAQAANIKEIFSGWHLWYQKIASAFQNLAKFDLNAPTRASFVVNPHFENLQFPIPGKHRMRKCARIHVQADHFQNHISGYSTIKAFE